MRLRRLVRLVLELAEGAGAAKAQGSGWPLEPVRPVLRLEAHPKPLVLPRAARPLPPELQAVPVKPKAPAAVREI